jgi:CheY-like chemotaxis protein
MPPRAPARPFGVLVVEDEPFILKLLAGYLKTFGVAAFGASCAGEAERLLRAHAGEIDAALIDLNLPGSDGLETRRRLDAIKPGLRFGLMSGAGLGGDAPPEGFCQSLGKPFGSRELRACLDELLDRAAPAA